MTNALSDTHRHWCTECRRYIICKLELCLSGPRHDQVPFLNDIFILCVMCRTFRLLRSGLVSRRSFFSNN